MDGYIMWNQVLQASDEMVMNITPMDVLDAFSRWHERRARWAANTSPDLGPCIVFGCPNWVGYEGPAGRVKDEKRGTTGWCSVCTQARVRIEEARAEIEEHRVRQLDAAHEEAIREDRARTGCGVSDADICIVFGCPRWAGYDIVREIPGMGRVCFRCWTAYRSEIKKHNPAPRRIRYQGPPRRGFVYRLFNGSGDLLYVGKTYSVPQRFYGPGGHARSKPWWLDVDTAAVTVYHTEADALAAEGIAIVKEKPLHNKLVPASVKPRAPRCVARYTGAV